MASVVIENFTGNTPLRADGTRWPFILVAGSKAVCADHNADLVNTLGPESYLAIPHGDAEAALLARGTLARAFAAIRQAALLDQHFEAHGEDAVSDDDLQVILAPRSEPLQITGAWTHPVRLVGVATDYKPYTDRWAPRGNVVLIDPYTDVTLLRSLHQAGVVEYLVHQDA